MLRLAVIIGGLGLWLAVGLGTKALRYFAHQPSETERIAQALTLLLAGQGWEVRDRDEKGLPHDQAVLETMTFSKPGCQQPLQLNFIWFGDATLQVLRGVAGLDIAFIQDGKITDSPDFDAQRLKISANSLNRLLSRPAYPDVPIIAIYPKNNVQGSPCSAEIAERWAHLEELILH